MLSRRELPLFRALLSCCCVCVVPAPGFICGIGWAIAQTAWFIANDTLQLPVAFPLVSVGPGIVASLWSVFMFKEITGTRNYIVLAAGFVARIIAAVLIALSR